MTNHYGLIVFGAGSGGIGAALAAARLGLSVLLVEKEDTIGGTAVRGGVHVWEPCAGSTGIPFEIYKQLKGIPNAVGIYSFGRHQAWQKTRQSSVFPGGEQTIDPDQRYINTLQKHGVRTYAGHEDFCRKYFHGVVFEPEKYVIIVERMLAESGCCTIRKNSSFTDVEFKTGEIKSVMLGNNEKLSADVYIDATGNGALCLQCGCDTVQNWETSNKLPPGDMRKKSKNAVTLIYRVTRAKSPQREKVTDDIPTRCWWAERFPAISASQYPNGDYNINMLPTMEYNELIKTGYGSAYDECKRRVLAHWRNLQEIFPEFRLYRLSWIAPQLGIRESTRILGEYVLTVNDALIGLKRQAHPDIIAIADHALDRHGKNGGYYGLDGPYGIPYRCLIPKGVKNLLIACKAASFDSEAASSCRLSRTMMQLGQAAGTAAALTCGSSVSAAEVPLEKLQRVLRAQHVQLEWPMPGELLAYLENE